MVFFHAKKVFKLLYIIVKARCIKGMLKRFTQYILGSERSESGIVFEDDDVDIVNGVVVHLKQNEKGNKEGGISEKSTSNIENSQKAVFIAEDGQGIPLNITQDNLNLQANFKTIEEITAEKEQQGNEDSIEKVAGLEEVGADRKSVV